MRMLKCPVCPWTMKFTGHFKSHYEMRDHVKEQHPETYAELEAAELEVQETYTRLLRRFGWAAKPMRML